MEDSKTKNLEIEVEGKSVEEAVKKAIELLKAPKSQLKIKVVAEEKKGLFGMQGANPAKIRASIISKIQPRKKS